MSFTEQVRDYLTTANLYRATATIVAAAFGISATTLGRNLRAEGARYSELVDQERQRRTRDYMRERGRRAHACGVLDRTGYREINSFYRAYRRWTGRSFGKDRMALPTSTRQPAPTP